jgi:hypothetical protein
MQIHLNNLILHIKFKKNFFKLSITLYIFAKHKLINQKALNISHFLQILHNQCNLFLWEAYI